jgi:hypothetical protein
MRLNSIDCVKGELVKKNHILLQFTGLLDKLQEELYELDVILIDAVRHVIIWNDESNGWCLKQLPEGHPTMPLEQPTAQRSVRLWSFFESTDTP